MLIHANDDNPKARKPLQCGLCEKRFKNWAGVKYHMEKNHGRVENYEDEMVHIRRNATKENTTKRQENRDRKRKQVENTRAPKSQPKRKKKKIVVISSSSSDPDMSDSTSADPENDEDDNSDESNICGSSDEDSDEQQCPQNPMVYTECRKPARKPKQTPRHRSSWSDKKKRQKNTVKLKLSPKQKKAIKKRLRYDSDNDSSSSDSDSDSNAPGPSKCQHRGGKRKKGMKKVSKLSDMEKKYLMGFRQMLKNSSTVTDRGIDMNVRIKDLNMHNIRKSLYRAYALMGGRPGLLSVNVGALLRSVDGANMRLWYPSENGISITVPGRPVNIATKTDVEKLLTVISKRLDRIIENAKQTFPASEFPFALKTEIPKTLQKNAQLSRRNLLTFSNHMESILTFFACICTFLRVQNEGKTFKQSQNVFRQAKKLLSIAQTKLRATFTKKNGQFRLELVPKLSELLKLDIGVWTTDHLGNDQHKVSTYSEIALMENYPEVQIFWLKNRFYLIKNIFVFLQRFPCQFCTRVFSKQQSVIRHQNDNSCLFLKFLKQNPDSLDPEYEFWFTDIVLERFFHFGRFQARDSLITRLEKTAGITVANAKYLSLQDYCLAFDIETSQTKPKYGNPDGLTSGFVSTHSILSISVATNIEQMNDVEGVCFINFDNTGNYLRDCLSYMLEAADIAYANNLRKYDWLLKQQDDIINAAIASQKTGFVKILEKLKSDILRFMKKLPCFGFNSSSFDLVALRHAGFFHMLQEFESTHPRAIKKANSYTMVDSGSRLLFLDILNYLSGKCSLRKFLKDMQIPESQRKLYFWYERFTPENSTKELMKRSPPKYRDFFSSLKNVNLLDEEYQEFSRLLQMGYSEAKALDALELTKRPLTGKEQYTEFLKDWIDMKIDVRYKYLARYCNRDVTSTLLAVLKFKKCFLSIGVNPFFYASLSSLAFPMLIKHLAQSCVTGADFFTAVNEEAFYLLKRSQIGGLCHAYNRLAICNVSKIKPHQYGKLAETIKQILQLDLNALYPSTIGKYCTTAAGFYSIRKSHDNFRYNTVMKKPHLAHSWIFYMEKMELKKRICHALSIGGERKLVFKDGGAAYPDGWIDDTIIHSDGTKVIQGDALNFHGCLWHACRPCYSWEIDNNVPHPCIKGMTFAQVWERTRKMDENIRNHDYVRNYYVKWEHQWLSDIKKYPLVAYFVRHSCHYGPPIVQQTMSETEAVKFIQEHKIVGFVECSLFVPEDKLEKYLEFPPIFVKETITIDQLKGKQKLIAENRNSLGSGQETVTAKFAGDDIVIGTNLFNWYLEAGLKLKKLSTILQFQENLAFGEWLNDMVDGRRQADAQNSTILANMWKLIGNGSYGFASMNMSKRKDVKFGDLKTLRYWMGRPQFFQAYDANEQNRTTDYFEIILNKYRVQEKLPLQFSCDVLSTSKMVLFQTLYDFCGKYFDHRKWTLLGLDTDGFAMGLSSSSLDDVVRPELRKEFETVKYQWLVPDESGPLKEKLKREPLYLKTEVKADLGAVFLAPKSYIIVDKSALTKSAHKGFSAKLNPDLVTLNSFVRALFSDGTLSSNQVAKLSGMRQNPLGQMATVHETRSSLSNLSIKFDYCNSDIHCHSRDLSVTQLERFYPYSECDINSESSVRRSLKLQAKDTPVRESSHFH